MSASLAGSGSVTAAGEAPVPPAITVAFFDLDRTLIDLNSGHSWVRHEWREGRLGLGAVAWSVGLFARYALGSEDLDAGMAQAASIYAGKPVAEVQATVQAWFDAEIRGRLRPGAAAALARHRDVGHPLVLATTSSHFAAACAREAFGLDDAIATVIGADGDTLDGTIADSAFGRHKHRRCAEWAAAHGHDLANAAFYTDSYSDVPLLRAVGHPFVVHPDRRLRREAERKGWPILDWGAA